MQPSPSGPSAVRNRRSWERPADRWPPRRSTARWRSWDISSRKSRKPFTRPAPDHILASFPIFAYSLGGDVRDRAVPGGEPRSAARGRRFAASAPEPGPWPPATTKRTRKPLSRQGVDWRGVHRADGQGAAIALPATTERTRGRWACVMLPDARRAARGNSTKGRAAAGSCRTAADLKSCRRGKRGRRTWAAAWRASSGSVRRR
jgi:hypothetical protein